MDLSIRRRYWFGRVLFAAVFLLTLFPLPTTHAADMFVRRNGTDLTLNGQPFRFGGPNMYWLGLDENVGGVDYPSLYRVNNGLDTVVAMGGTVVRAPYVSTYRDYEQHVWHHVGVRVHLLPQGVAHDHHTTGCRRPQDRADGHRQSGGPRDGPDSASVAYHAHGCGFTQTLVFGFLAHTMASRET